MYYYMIKSEKKIMLIKTFFMTNPFKDQVPLFVTAHLFCTPHDGPRNPASLRMMTPITPAGILHSLWLCMQEKQIFVRAI